MTVKLVTDIQRFQGESTDDKPSDIAAGSTFLEEDTSTTFVYDGADWQQVNTIVVGEDGKPIARATNEILEELLLETRLLRHALVLGGIVENIDEPVL